MFRSLGVLLGLTLASPAFAAFDVYLTYPGIPGDSDTQGYLNQIVVSGLDVSGFRVAEVGNVAGAGNPKLAEVKLVKDVDKATPLLFLESLMGVPNAQDAVFHFVRVGAGTPPPFLIVTLKSPMVTGYAVDGEVANSVPVETVTLAYDEICIAHQQFNSSGNAVGSPVERCWNAATQTGN